MLNQVNLIGRVGKEPEIKTFDSGSRVANFSLATSEKYKGEEKTQWHNITVMGKTVDVVEKYVKKGDLLHLTGKIEYRSWDDKDGNKKYITEILVFGVTMLGGGSKNDSSTPEPSNDDDFGFE